MSEERKCGGSPNQPEIIGTTPSVSAGDGWSIPIYCPGCSDCTAIPEPPSAIAQSVSFDGTQPVSEYWSRSPVSLERVEELVKALEKCIQVMSEKIGCGCLQDVDCTICYARKALAAYRNRRKE